MADSSILPGVRAALVTSDGKTTPEFYRLFQALAKSAGLTGDLNKKVTEIIRQIEETGSGKIISGSGITVSGTLANGVVTISLAGTSVAPGVYGDDTHIPRVTVDKYGRVTHAEVVEIQAGFVPYRVPSGTVFRVPEGKQALWTIPIELEGDAGLEIDGALVEVA